MLPTYQSRYLGTFGGGGLVVRRDRRVVGRLFVAFTKIKHGLHYITLCSVTIHIGTLRYITVRYVTARYDRGSGRVGSGGARANKQGGACMIRLTAAASKTDDGSINTCPRRHVCVRPNRRQTRRRQRGSSAALGSARAGRRAGGGSVVRVSDDVVVGDSIDRSTARTGGRGFRVSCFGRTCKFVVVFRARRTARSSGKSDANLGPEKTNTHARTRVADIYSSERWPCKTGQQQTTTTPPLLTLGSFGLVDRDRYGCFGRFILG